MCFRELSQIGDKEHGEDERLDYSDEDRKEHPKAADHTGGGVEHEEEQPDDDQHQLADDDVEVEPEGESKDLGDLLNDFKEPKGDPRQSPERVLPTRGDDREV